MTRVAVARAVVVWAIGVGSVGAQTPPVVRAALSTEPLYNYEGAPATPDADDPAIWIDRRDPDKSLVIGTAKDAGLLVYDLRGRLIQAILPPNAPQVGLADPATPAGLNPAPDDPCAESASGETFGRFNNVDIAYDVRLGTGRGAARADVAVVSDRGCDRIRFFRIERSHPAGPLVDVTAPDVPRVFPDRYDQPSPLQPSGAVEGWSVNPLDDQNTVYGIAVAQHAGRNELFVSQRERGLVRQLRIIAAPGGRLTYRLERTFLFDTSFELKDEHGVGYTWTPCREAAVEEPQSEGVVVDVANETLYVAFETIGLYKLPLRASLPAVVGVGRTRLIEPVITFGRAYHASPDDGAFECEYDPEGAPDPGDVVAPGSPVNAGAFLQADLEGLTIVASPPGQTLMLASSQGDSSFHFYWIRRTATHAGAFLVEGVGDSDGVHYAPARFGERYPLGLLVVQNGDAPEPADTGDVNGYEFDGATQFKYVSFADVLKAVPR